MTPRRMASDLKMPWHNLAHFCCAKLCHSKFRVSLRPALAVKHTEGRFYISPWLRAKAIGQCPKVFLRHLGSSNANGPLRGHPTPPDQPQNDGFFN